MPKPDISIRPVILTECPNPDLGMRLSNQLSFSRVAFPTSKYMIKWRMSKGVARGVIREEANPSKRFW